MRDLFHGCLIGGAVGDALGAAVEFDDWNAIRRRYGDAGVRDFEIVYGFRGAITDDTQMTLFTAEGLLRARVQGNDADAVTAVHRAYLRWLRTQDDDYSPDGWLSGDARLWNARAPGATCLSALREATLAEFADNDSKGCGTVMRAAPFGLMTDDAFDLARQCSALTHGHPTGQIAGAAFAALIGCLLRGKKLSHAVVDTLHKTQQEECKMKVAPETSDAIKGALQLVENNIPPHAASIESLGGGWIAEEALAIAIYCALCAENFADGVIRAVNHSGDSDSTGAITGNLLGVVYGYNNIPKQWRETVELADVIATLANDLFLLSALTQETPNKKQLTEIKNRYPTK